MAYNSKYTGEQVEERLDAVSNKVDEAPSTNQDYVRRNGQWVIPTYDSNLTIIDASTDEYEDLF